MPKSPPGPAPLPFPSPSLNPRNASRSQAGALRQLRKSDRIFECVAAGVVVEVDEHVLARLPGFRDALHPCSQRGSRIPRRVRALALVEPHEPPLGGAP